MILDTKAAGVRYGMILGVHKLSINLELQEELQDMGLNGYLQVMTMIWKNINKDTLIMTAFGKVKAGIRLIG